MKVLFIDDEPLIRKGLKVIIPWEKYGFTELFEAENGTEGLELIMAENPELVLLDIHMEDMSGLSLAKKARENDFVGRIVILSGYSDFEYAKAAIDYGVTSYLLKPVDPALLTEAVLKSIDELQKERLISIYNNQPAHLAKNRILSGILLGDMLYSSDIENIYNLNLTSNYYRLASLHISEDSTEDTILKELLTDLKKKYISVYISDAVLVLILTSSAQEQTLNKQLQSYWEEAGNDSSLIAVISCKAESVNQLSSLYKEIQFIYQDIYYYKKKNCNLLAVDSMSRHSDSDMDTFNLISLTESLIDQILLLDNAEVERSTLILLDHFILRKPPRDSICFILLNCYTQITTKLLHYYPKLEFEIADKEKFTAHLYSDSYLCDSITYLNSQLQRAITYIKMSSQGSPCQRICQYIDENLSLPLKLKTIADIFGYNSAYLGKMFARETGDHFNIYLDKRRIEKAKEYLEKGFSVSQACDQSGFTNTDYFTKKFKKYVGTLPSEYKKSANNSGIDQELPGQI